MLNKKVLIDKLGNEYKAMINKISIPDFTKCIAQYSGIPIQNVKDEIIEDYLTKWAVNKKYIFDLFGGETRVDMPITFTDEDRDYCGKIMDIAKQYPIYYPWLNMFKNQVKNKIDYNALYWQDTDMLKSIFPNYKIDGVSITHFFKNKIEAPDELVTAIGRVFENAEINATYTLSIDPVDIMFSSENPYNWTSCYRLEHFEESHADGCLAGVLDVATVMSYVWNREGEYCLYGKYDFKNIRYKKVRITLAFNETLNAVHFNAVYPWKGDCSDDFKKLIRNKVETFLCEKTGKENLWKKYDRSDMGDLKASRIYSEYGYSEYDSDYVYVVKNDTKWDEFKIYNEPIMCPCGCGQKYIGSDDSDYMQYNGDGHTNDNWYEEEDDYSWEEWRVYDIDGNELYCTEWDEDTAIDWAVSNEGDTVEHHWGDSYNSDYEVIWKKSDYEETVTEAIEEQPTNETVSLVVDPNTITNNTVWRTISSTDYIINSTDNIKKDLAFYKILSGEDFTKEDFRLALEEQYEDPVLPSMTEYKLSNSNGDRHISISVPNAVIGTEEFINVIKAQIHN